MVGYALRCIRQIHCLDTEKEIAVSPPLPIKISEQLQSTGCRENGRNGKKTTQNQRLKQLLSAL